MVSQDIFEIIALFLLTRKLVTVCLPEVRVCFVHFSIEADPSIVLSQRTKTPSYWDSNRLN